MHTEENKTIAEEEEKMSENKREITIDIPKGYEKCEPREATYIQFGRDLIKGVQCNLSNDPYITCPYTGEDRDWEWVERHALAYLRRIPKPVPFCANFIDICIPFKTYESDSHGHVTDIVTSYCIELPGGAGPYRKGMRFSVKIEEIIED